MKKIRLMLLLLCGISSTQAKIIPVTDVTHIQENLRSWLSKVMKEECKDKQMEYIKQQLINSLEMYTKVSNVISPNHLSYINHVLKNQSVTFDRINQFYKTDHVADPEVFNMYKDKISRLAKRLSNNIEYSEKLGKPSIKMNDGERLEQYDRLDRELKEINSDLDTYYTYYKALNSQLHILRQLLK